MTGTNQQPKDCFEIGGEDLLAPAPAESVQEHAAAKDTPPLPLPRETLDDIRVRVGTLLKTETVSFLLGAGASVDCGGPLIGTIPLMVERTILNLTVSLNSRHYTHVFVLFVRNDGCERAV
jgi:hypothetical protein